MVPENSLLIVEVSGVRPVEKPVSACGRTDQILHVVYLGLLNRC